MREAVSLTFARRPDAPDRVVFDLDPDPAVPWARVKETAAAVRARLEALELLLVQHVVAVAMAPAVVDLLEVVDVDV